MSNQRIHGRFRAMTNEEFVEELRKKNPKVVPDEPYTNMRTKMQFHCVDYPEHVFITTPRVPMNSGGCVICNRQIGPQAVKRLNRDPNYKSDRKIAAKRPDLVPYLHNKEDAYRYAPHTKEKLEWECPCCGYIFIKTGHEVAQDGFRCPICMTGISYPNRLMRIIFDKLKVLYIPEFIPKWANGRRYDFSFVTNNQNYVLEMDGSFHYRNGFALSGVVSLEEREAIDDIKTSLAEQNGYQVIRINCDYGGNSMERLSFIQKNILASELAILFDFSKIDFKECGVEADKNDLNRIIEYWDIYKDIDEVAKQLGMRSQYVYNRLKTSEELGIGSFNLSELKARNKAHTLSKISTPISVRCVETGEIFNSIHAANKKYHASLSRYFKGRGKTSGRLLDGTRLTWEKLT